MSREMNDPAPDDEPSASAAAEDTQRRPMGELAYGELKREIIEGDLVPASQWLEEELAVRLGMSRTPVREALVATDIPGEQTIMPWKRVKFDELGQNNDADPVLLQYIGGKFVTIFPPQAAIAEAVWPMK